MSRHLVCTIMQSTGNIIIAFTVKITSLDVQLLHQVKEDESWAGILLNRKTESDESLIKWLRNKIKEEILFL